MGLCRLGLASRDVSRAILLLMCPPSARRQDNKVSFGYSAMRGKRASMEDYYHAQVRPPEPA